MLCANIDDNQVDHMTIEEIVFLGAGASAADGAPVQNRLFKEYFENDPSNDAISQSLSQFFKDFFGIDTSNNLRNIEFPTFEEILGILEFAIKRDESFKGYSLTPDKPEIQKIREDLIFLIAIILDKKLQGKSEHHRELLKRLKKEISLEEIMF